MFDTFIFYLVFIGQIFLLSYYYPNIIQQRMKYVYEKFPPASYPKLYPQQNPEVSAWNAHRKIRNYNYFNQFVVSVGVILLLMAMLTGYSPHQVKVDAVVAGYAMLQFAPIFMLEIGEYKLLKIMRNANTSSKRSTVLKPRKLFDFVSPWYVVAAVLLIILNVFHELYLFRDLDVWTAKQTIKLASTNVVHFFFIGMIGWQLYGKKRNPLQTYDDRLKNIGVLIKSAVFVSILASIFFLANSALNQFQLSHLDPLVMSVYFQLVAFFGLGLTLQSIQVEDIDFDVYRAGPVKS